MKKTYTLSALLSLAFTGNVVMSQSGSQAFTASGSFVATTTSINIEVVGAGGSGGTNGDGGGGGGGYALGTYPVVVGNTYFVTIGTGGGGSATGTTSVGALISATAGANGFMVANPNVGGGGAGGTGIGGNIVNRTGGAGGGGYWTYFGGGGGGAAGSLSNGSIGGNTIVWTGVCMTPGGAAGAGGGAPGGSGGKGAGFTDAACNVTDPAAGGSNYGGGGGGGNGNGGGPGTGANGYCVISWGTTSIKDVSLSNDISIYPNPATNEFQVSLNESLGTSSKLKIETVKIINVMGECVFLSPPLLGGREGLIDISSLPKGIYFVQVKTESGVVNKKIIKE